MESFEGKRDSCGTDGVKLSALGEYWEANGEKIKKAILEGKYKNGSCATTRDYECKGKKRTISLMNTVDRFIYRALMQEMAKEWLRSSRNIHMHIRSSKGIKERSKKKLQNIWKTDMSGV